MSYRSPEDFAAETGERLREMRATIRRVRVMHARGRLWQVNGATTVNGQQVGQTPIFPGIGFYSRPRKGKGEAIVAQIAGPVSTAIVATRDDEMRRTMMGDEGEDDAAVFNSECIVLVRDGKVEARTKNGTAVQLATLQDVADQRAAAVAHTHQYNSPSGLLFTAGPSNALTWPTPVGTQCFRGE